MGSRYCLVVTTTADLDSARALAGEALRRKLAACVQIYPVESHFVWDGQTQHEREYALHIKTAAGSYDALAAAIGELHAYDTPEILRFDVTGGYGPYLRWIDESVTVADADGGAGKG